MKKLKFIFILLISCELFSQNQIFNRIPCEKVHIPVCIHNIAYKFNSFKNYSSEIEILKGQFKYLEEACIYLDICLIDSIRDYNFYNLSDEDRSKELIALVNTYHKPYYLNIYFNETHGISSYNGIAKSNKDTSFIALSKSSFIYPVQIKALLLNYFGLDETSNDGDLEFVNGTNSKITADSLWDTPADPFYNINPNFKVLPPLAYYGAYLYIESKDPNGDYYNVMYDNFMSPFKYSLFSVCNKLTRNQWQRIATNESKYRFNHWLVEK